MLDLVSRSPFAIIDGYTRLVSLEASLSTGIMNRKKNIDRIAKPFVARAWKEQRLTLLLWRRYKQDTHDNSVVPSKNRELIQSSNQIPPGGYVAGYEDAEGQDRERVHESTSIAGALLS